MIVLGADMHKGSHTIAGIAATTGEMLGDKTVGVGVRGFDQVLDWARGLRRCGRSSIPSLGARRGSGDCLLSGRGPTLSTSYPGAGTTPSRCAQRTAHSRGPVEAPVPPGPALSCDRCSTR
jgi:hypothetical protein